MKALDQKMQVLVERSGKIAAAYVPDGALKPGAPQVTLVADERRSVHEVNVPSSLIEAGLSLSILNRYRVRIDGGRGMLVLNDEDVR
jgi:hypothetical protein